MGRLYPHARGPDVPDREPLLRLEIRVRARAGDGRPDGLPRARQGARRVELDQRDDLPAREPDGLRALGGRARDGVLGVRQLPAVLQADGDVPRRRRRVPRRRRAARARARPGGRRAVPGVLPGRPAGRLPADERRQRLPPGGLRGVRPQHPSRPPAERGAGLPAPGHEAPEPRRRDARVRDARPLRRHEGDRRRVHRLARADPPRPLRRGRAVRRGVQLAAGAPGVGDRQCEGARRGRREGVPRPAGRRREPPGPPRGLRPVREQEARVGRAGAQVQEPAGGRGRSGSSGEPARARPTTSRAAASSAATTRWPTRT